MITDTIEQIQVVTELQYAPTHLDNLYTYIITNRKHARYDWHAGYKFFTKEIEKVRQNLTSSKSLRDKEVYEGTVWEKEKEPFLKFMDKLVMEDSNGISSNGQSIVSKNNFRHEDDLFLNDDTFVAAVESVIRITDNDNFHKLIQAWKIQKEKGENVVMNHLLINRIMAASTLSVSSTVNEEKFDKVYSYLKEKNLVQESEDDTDWFVKNQQVMSDMKKGLSHYDGETALKDDDVWLSIFVWELYVHLAKPFDLQKQVVRYGAPGTGKTYTARLDSELQFNIWKAEYHPSYEGDINSHVETVQFHPSFGYEDFIEGLRPIPGANGTELKLVNGVFKDFCKKSGKWELDLYKTFNGKNIDWSSFTIEDFLKDEKAQQLLNTNRWAYVSKINSPSFKLLADALPPFFFIIDEINRAELSRVMGELMFCLEKRGTAGAIKSQYSQLNDPETALINSGNDISPNYRFFIPINIYIIGTMNTIDRSVESFDFALRRRFYWEQRNPDYEVLKHHYFQNHTSDWIDLADSLYKLNEKIEQHELLSEDHQIGHAYLMNLPYRKDTPKREVKLQVWKSRISPLLDEYLRGTGSDSSQFRSSFGI